MRRAIIVVLVIASSLTPSRVQAATNIYPSTYKLVIGKHVSPSPLTELAADDDTYLVVDAGRVHHKHKVAYLMNFVNVAPPGNMAVVFTGFTSPPPCNLQPFLYDWHKKRFVTNSIVGIPGNEITSSDGLSDPTPYIKNGKVRAKYVCTADGPFTLSTDEARLSI